MNWLAMLAGLALVACVSPVPSGAAKTVGNLWCFDAAVESRRGQRAVGCFDTLPLCREALGTAKRLGRLAGVVRLGSCEVRESR